MTWSVDIAPMMITSGFRGQLPFERRDGAAQHPLVRRRASRGEIRPGAGERELDRAALVYLPTQDGYLGLLFEAGEWVALPADKPHFFDAGEAKSFDGLPAALPLFEAFVEQVLSLTGNDADDDA